MELFSKKAIIESLKIATEDDVDFLFDLGTSFAKNNDFQMSIPVFDKINKLCPKYIDAWNSKGYALVDLGKHEEAIKCFDKVIEIDKEDANAWSDKGASLASLKRYSEALLCIEKSIKLNKNNPNSFVNKAIILVDLGEYNEAVEYCERAISLDPSHFEARFCKGDALSRKKEYEKAIQSYDKAIEINPKNMNLLVNKSINLIHITKFNEAIECCNKVLAIDPRIVEALINKGIALTCVEKFLEAIECFDKSININPNFEKAWYNKAWTLTNLKNYDEAIKCYDNVIQIDPNFPEAYSNKGIALAQLHKYDEAEEEFKKASSLFSNRGGLEEFEKTKKHIEVVLNAKEIIEQFKTFDERFLNSLNSKTLIDLKEKILSILKDMEIFYNLYRDRTIPEDVDELLLNKEQCLTILSKALDFDLEDRSQLTDAKNIFEKWGLIDYIVALNSLDSFIIYLQCYKDLRDIPKDVEKRLLFVLKNLHVLDGQLTNEISISRNFKGELFGPQLTDIRREPVLNDISICMDVDNEYIRICLIQLDFSLSKRFPYKLEGADLIKSKILKALDIAKEEKANIVCLPELSSSKDFIEDIKNYEDIIIIAGSYYENNFNMCPVIFNKDVYFVYKINPSPYIESEIAPNKGMTPGDDLKIFITKNFRFSVLVCLDYLMEGNRLCSLSGDNKNNVNFIFNPSNNSDIERFQRRANSDCENYHVDLMQVNVKEHGGTCIVGIEHKKYLERMINEGYRKKDDIYYKICEANGEMMIIADISTRGVEVPTHVEARPRTRIHSGYVYMNNSWQKKLDTWWNNS